MDAREENVRTGTHRGAFAAACQILRQESSARFPRLLHRPSSATRPYSNNKTRSIRGSLHGLHSLDLPVCRGLPGKLDLSLHQGERPPNDEQPRPRCSGPLPGPPAPDLPQHFKSGTNIARWDNLGIRPHVVIPFQKSFDLFSSAMFKG